MEKLDKIMRAIEKKKIMRATELEKAGASRMQLRRLAEAGKLIALGSGFYAHSSLDPFAAFIIATARYFPKAVISNITALAVHGLTDERMDRVDVDIPRQSSIRNKLITPHRVSKSNIVGVMRMDYEGQKIRIYCPERALCDAYRIDPDGPIFLKALKRYIKAGNLDPDKIAKYDRVLSTDVLRSFRQEVADA